MSYSRTVIDLSAGTATVVPVSADEIPAYVPPGPTADDVRAEAQRRIVTATGASDLQSCIIRQLNANMRANELNDIRHERALTAEEEAEAAALRALADHIKAIRAASNVLEVASPIPADYANNSHWPAGA